VEAAPADADPVSRRNLEHYSGKYKSLFAFQCALPQDIEGAGARLKEKKF
jgi:hypothetical protein